MAELQQFKCPCGHEVLSCSRGYYALMRGMVIQFRCTKCKDIVEVPVDELHQHFPFFRCPVCGNEHSLVTWNPVDGKCPKCGKHKMQKTDLVIMAD